MGHKFVVHTDHKSLQYLLGQTVTTLAQQKWIAKLLGYDFVIEYKKGKENSAADALSRQFEEGEINAISQPIPNWADSIMEENQKSVEAQELIQHI